MNGDRDAGGAGHTLRAHRNCCVVAAAHKAAVLIDGEAYFAALDTALRGARRSILIIGWDFDGRIRLRPQDGPDAPQLGYLLRALAEAQPELQVRVLVWSLAVIHTPSSVLPLLLGADWQRHDRIRLRLDTHHPFYAAHHQKIVVIDDSLAFTGGMDLTVERWDTRDHAPHHALRRTPDGKPYGPVHDVQLALEGPAARQVAQIARGRWHAATGEMLSAGSEVERWPEGLEPHFSDVPVAVSRTAPRYRRDPAIQEIDRLNGDLLRAARHTVYIEAQYFTARRLRSVLGEVLAQPEGPEIVVVCTRVANGMLERLIMGANRERLLRRLKAADRHDRLRVYYPVSGPGEQRLLIHAKVMIVDDRFLRIGSANLNNRSVGLDTECDVTIDGTTEAARATIRQLRDSLVAEHLGCEAAAVHARMVRRGSLSRAIDELARHEGRCLHPMKVGPGAIGSFPGTRLLDPERPFRLLAWLRGLWRAQAERRRDTANSETASITPPSTRGTRK